MYASPIAFTAVSVRSLVEAARSNSFDIRIRQVSSRSKASKSPVEERTLSGHCFRAVLFAGECGRREQRLGIGISLPLPFWDRNAGNIASSKAREQQARPPWLRRNAKWNGASTQSAATLEAKRDEIEKWQVRDDREIP